MVRRLIPQDLCDMHNLLGLEETLAEGSIILSLNKGPAKEYDLCGRCLIALQPAVELYQSTGRRPDEGERKEARKKARKEIEPEPGNELPPSSPGRAVTQYPTSTMQKNLTDAHVVCTEDHPHYGGGPLAVRYKTRGTHASAAHNKEIWGITWEDPDGVATIPCHEHRVCKEAGLTFTSPQGLSQHKLKHPPA